MLVAWHGRAITYQSKTLAPEAHCLALDLTLPTYQGIVCRSFQHHGQVTVLPEIVHRNLMLSPTLEPVVTSYHGDWLVVAVRNAERSFVLAGIFSINTRSIAHLVTLLGGFGDPWCSRFHN